MELRDEEENFEKKIVSRRGGMQDARNADARINFERYGKEGR